MNYILLEDDQYPFSIMSTLKHMKIDEEIDYNFFKEKFGKEDNICVIYEGVPMRILNGKITFYEKNYVKALRFINELTVEYREKLNG